MEVHKASDTDVWNLLFRNVLENNGTIIHKPEIKIMTYEEYVIECF